MLREENEMTVERRFLEHLQHAVLRTFREILRVLDDDAFFIAAFLYPVLYGSYLINSGAGCLLSKCEKIVDKPSAKSINNAFHLVSINTVLKAGYQGIHSFRIREKSTASSLLILFLHGYFPVLVKGCD